MDQTTMTMDTSSFLHDHPSFTDSCDTNHITRLHSSQSEPGSGTPARLDHCVVCHRTDTPDLPFQHGSASLYQGASRGGPSPANSCCTSHCAYPSPPTTSTSLKHSIALPNLARESASLPREPRIEIVGILDSPPVMRNDELAFRPPLSPPPTLPTSMSALPETDGEHFVESHIDEFDSPSAPQCFMAGSEESRCSCLSPRQGVVARTGDSNKTALQLLSPISPTWTSTEMSDLSTVPEEEESALLSDYLPFPLSPCSAHKECSIVGDICEASVDDSEFDRYSEYDTPFPWMPLSPAAMEMELSGEDEDFTDLPNPDDMGGGNFDHEMFVSPSLQQSPLATIEDRESESFYSPDRIPQHLTPWEPPDDRSTPPASPVPASRSLHLSEVSSVLESEPFETLPSAPSNELLPPLLDEHESQYDLSPHTNATDDLVCFPTHDGDDDGLAAMEVDEDGSLQPDLQSFPLGVTQLDSSIPAEQTLIPQHESPITFLSADGEAPFFSPPSSPLMRKRSLELDDDEPDPLRSPSSPSRRSFTSLPDLELDDPVVSFEPPSSPGRSLVALPGADTDEELLPDAPPNFIPEPELLHSPVPSSPCRSLLLIDDPNDVPLPRSPSPEDFDLDIDDTTDPELTKLYNLRKRSLAAEHAARQQEARWIELGALGMRAEARRVRKQEKERSKEVGALLRLKLASKDSSRGVAPLGGDSTSTGVISSISQLVARMMFRRHEKFRPLMNRRVPSTPNHHAPSSLSQSISSTDYESHGLNC